MKEWLTKTKPEEEADVLKDEENLPKDTEGKEAITDLTKSGLLRSAVVSSLPKINLPVFHGDPCEWPNWYGMFNALVHDQRLTKTQKIIYLKPQYGDQRRKPSLQCSLLEQCMKKLSRN